MANRVLAVIPARAGSKRIPLKNFTPVHGKSLVERAIEQVFSAQIADQIVVSTDRPDLVNIPKGIACAVHARSAEAASDTASAALVIQEVIRAFPDFQTLIYLQPTSPLRTPEDIKKALAMYREGSFDSVVSVGPVDKSLHFALTRGSNRKAEFIFPNVLDRRTQDLPEIFTLNGAIYISSTKQLMGNPTFLSGSVGTYVMSAESSLDVDTLEDWKKLEAAVSR